MFHMQPVRGQSEAWVAGGERAPGSDQTYPIGTPVTWDTGSQELDEHALSTTVTGILGVSLDGVDSGTADNPSGNVVYAYAGRMNVFMAALTNGSGVVQTPDAANVDVQYGLLKTGTGLDAWFSVDEDDTTNVVAQVVGYDTHLNGGNGIVFFKFIESAIQSV